MMRSRAAAAALAGALLASAAAAQPPGSRRTREFVQAAAQSDRFEILEAHTVLAESRDAKVRTFAQAMIAAHQRTGDALRQAVARAGLAQPAPGTGGDQSMFLAALQSQRGADFDRAYVTQQVLAHRAALAVERDYAATGDDGAIRAAAAATVPIVTAHLRMAERMQAGMTGG